MCLLSSNVAVTDVVVTEIVNVTEIVTDVVTVIVTEIVIVTDIVIVAVIVTVTEIDIVTGIGAECDYCYCMCPHEHPLQ